MALRGAGLARLTGDRFTLFGTAAGLASDNVLAVLVDRAGTLWVGTDAGLDRFEGDRFVHAGPGEGLPAGGVRAIHEDRSGRLWIGVLGGALGARFADGALCVRNGRRFDVLSTGAGLPSMAVMTMLDDRDGNLWLGTAGGGIVRVRAGRFESSRLMETTSDDMVYALAEDSEGNLWVGTQPGGLHRLRNSRFVTHEGRDGLTDGVIESLLEDRQGVMWIGTHAGGVCTLERGVLEVPHDEERAGPRPREHRSLEDPDGTMWLGTEGGVNRIAADRSPGTHARRSSDRPRERLAA